MPGHRARLSSHNVVLPYLGFGWRLRASPFHRGNTAVAVLPASPPCPSTGASVPDAVVARAGTGYSRVASTGLPERHAIHTTARAADPTSSS